MRVKGTSILATEKFIRNKFGEQGYGRFLEALPPGSKDLYSTTVLSPKWYPIDEAFYIPMETAGRLFFQGKSEQAAREMGRFSAQDGLRGIYQAFARLASVDYMLKKTANIFATYYRPGKMEVAQRGDRLVVIRMTDIVQPQVLLEERISGWLEGALAVCGEKDGRVMVDQSMAEGKDSADFVVKY